MSQILIDPYQNVQIPIEGIAGAGRVERLWCLYARDLFYHPGRYTDERGQLEAPIVCRNLHVDIPVQDHLIWRCGLTGDTCPCLFDEPHDPQWAIISNSVLLEDEEQAQPA